MKPLFKLLAFAFGCFIMSATARAQQCQTDPNELWRHEFRSFQNGAWDDSTTWEEYYPETAQWCWPAENLPDSAKGAITIQSYTNGTADTVWITSPVFADQLVVEGRLEIRGPDGHLTVTKGSDNAAYDLTGGGNIVIDGGLESKRLTVANTAKIHIKVGGQLQIIEGPFTSLAARGSSGSIENFGEVFIEGRLMFEGGTVTGNPFRYGPSAILILKNTANVIIENNNPLWPSTDVPRTIFIQGPGAVTLNGARTAEELYLYTTFHSGNYLTVNRRLSMQPGGFITGTPAYASGSILHYATGGTYARGEEWSATSGAGYPANVAIENNTMLNYPNGSNAARSMSGNLTIYQGAGLRMDFGNAGVNQPLTVGGNVHFEGALSLGDAPGGDLHVGGHWTTTNNRGVFTPNGRTVVFNGATEQQIGGINSSHTFDHVTINNPAGVALTNPATIRQSLTFVQGNFTLPYILTLSGAVNGASRTSHAVTPHSGYVARTIAVGESFQFPVGGSATSYNPVTIARTGFGGPQTFYVQVKDSLTMPPKLPERVLRRQWGISAGGFFNGDLTFQWEEDDPRGALFNPAEGVAMGWHNGAEWVQTPATYHAGPPPRATVSLTGAIGGIFGIGNPGALTNVAERAETPAEFALHQNYPNPFNPTTVIGYAVPIDTKISLGIYNTLGQKVVALVEGRVSKGYYEVGFDASQLASGVYVCRMQAGSFVKSIKLLLSK